MVNTFVAIGLGALIALSPLAAMAQSDGRSHASGPGRSRDAQLSPRRRRRVAQKAFAPQRQHAQGEGEGGSGTHAPDAHGAGRAQELINPGSARPLKCAPTETVGPAR